MILSSYEATLDEPILIKCPGVYQLLKILVNPNPTHRLENTAEQVTSLPHNPLIIGPPQPKRNNIHDNILGAILDAGEWLILHDTNETLQISLYQANKLIDLSKVGHIFKCHLVITFRDELCCISRILNTK